MAIPNQVEDGPLALSRRRFGDATHGLIDPAPLWSHGTCHWSDSIYARLRGALTARALGRSAMAGSRAPLSIGALTLVLEIDRGVRAWAPDVAGTTADRLRDLVGRSWRPQDCGRLDDHTAVLARWVTSAAALLGDSAVVVPLRDTKCPACGVGLVQRTNGAGEQSRAWALTVSEAGARCAACWAYWGPERFEFLAALLDCPAPPT